MVKERYCSFEVSKLLREKGFNEPCRSVYIDCGDYIDFYYSVEEQTDLQMGVWEILRPTHQMAMDWISKKYDILICIIPQEVAVGVNVLCYGIYKITKNSYHPIYNGKSENSNDYRDVVDAALKYVLENLI